MTFSQKVVMLLFLTMSHESLEYVHFSEMLIISLNNLKKERELPLMITAKYTLKEIQIKFFGNCTKLFAREAK